MSYRKLTGRTKECWCGGTVHETTEIRTYRLIDIEEDVVRQIRDSRFWNCMECEESYSDYEQAIIAEDTMYEIVNPEWQKVEN